MLEFDLIITNGVIVDGMETPWFRADIGVKKGRICKIGKIKPSRGEIIIDAKRKIVTPGFIDIHSHSDYSYLISPKAESKILQGITTDFNGNCGDSAAPLKGLAVEAVKKQAIYGISLEDYGIEVDWSDFQGYFSKLENRGIGVNAAFMVGHGTVRLCVLGYEDRNPSDDELAEMKQLVRVSMEQGVFGLSTGLVYPPGFYSDTAELIELAKIVAKYGGLYATHVRGDRQPQIVSLEEAIGIGQEAGVAVQVSHLATKYPLNVPEYQKVKMSMMELARGNGVDITTDTHHMSQWWSRSVLPGLSPFPWRVMRPAELAELLKIPEKREEFKNDLHLDPWDRRARGGPFGITQDRGWHLVKLYVSELNRELEGKTIEEIAKIKGADPEDVLIDMFIQEGGRGPIMLNKYMECDIPTLAPHPLVVFPVTDGCAIDIEKQPPNNFQLAPQWLGEFPLVLEKYVREERVLSMEKAIRKMTSLPARRIGIFDRGIIAPGMWADIVIFNKENIRNRGTVEHPMRTPQGIDYVIVNGKIAATDEKHTGVLAGKVLHRGE
jgi:N-acyl-D-amino-acid deacylase